MRRLAAGFWVLSNLSNLESYIAFARERAREKARCIIAPHSVFAVFSVCMLRAVPRHAQHTAYTNCTLSAPSLLVIIT
jgi:hypothetical protein